MLFISTGLTGTIYCVGASPEDMIATIKSELSVYNTENELQEAVAQYMFSLMGGDTTTWKKIDFQRYSSWEEKVEACVRTLLRQVSFSAQYTRGLIETAYTRLVQVRNYKPNPQPLRSLVVLLQASDIEHSSKIQGYSQQPVVTYNLQAPIAFAAEELRCASIINKHLNSDIIEAFDNKNLCDTYLMNKDTFMSLNQD